MKGVHFNIWKSVDKVFHVKTTTTTITTNKKTGMENNEHVALLKYLTQTRSMSIWTKQLF